MSLFHDAMIENVERLADAGSTSLDLYRVRKGVSIRFPIVVPCCCTTSKVVPTSDVKQNIAAEKLFVKCLEALDGIHVLQKNDKRQPRQIMLARK